MFIDPERLTRLWAALQSPLSFLLGTTVIVYEMAFAHPVELYIVAVGGGLVGLPLFRSTRGSE